MRTPTTTKQDFVEITSSLGIDNQLAQWFSLSTEPTTEEWSPQEDQEPLDDQAWFWTAEWQAGEKEADEDIRAGRVYRLTAEDIQNRIRSLSVSEDD